MKGLPSCNEVFLSFVPGNDPAEAVIKKVDFKSTGAMDDGEIIMRCNCSS